MSSFDHPQGPVDFRGLDFARLWSGREKTTEVEQLVVADSLEGHDTRRILEIGPGGGRIASVLLNAGGEFVGVDVTLEFLVRLRARWDGTGRWVAADLARLPLSPESFTGAVLVRVYNFLTQPYTSVRELHRVLAPGGWLLVSYFSEPSVATAWGDLRRRVRESRPIGAGLQDSGYRPRLPSRESFRTTFEEAGFEWEGERSVGLEDFRPLRWLPTDLFLALGRAFGHTGALPHHFVLFRKRGAPPRHLPTIESIWQCPECRIPASARGEPTIGPCPGCGRRFSVLDGIPDLRPIRHGVADPEPEVIRVRSP